MEDRDANEFAVVLAGYYRLIVGKCSIIHNTHYSLEALEALETIKSIFYLYHFAESRERA